jgi:Leucine-rich repeat (LRR) protein
MLITEEIINEWKKKGNSKRVLNFQFVNEEQWPDIPDEVEKLNIFGSDFLEITKLPKNLRRLTCCKTRIRTLPQPLPENLEYIDCRGCYKLLPFDVPPNVRVLSDMDYYENYRKEKRERKTMDHYELAKQRINKWIEENKTRKDKTELNLRLLNYKEFPPIPDDVISLNCEGNRLLKSLKGLPKGLKKLYCGGCTLKELIGLPDGLEYLNCDNSDIEVLDNLPNSIKTIKITYYYSKLRTIKSLPSELKVLDLELLTSLTEIQCEFPLKLRKLNLFMTNLEKIPKLPDSVRYVDISHTAINELTYLPPNLKVLSIETTYIRELPELPSTLVCMCYDKDRITITLPKSVRTTVMYN